MTTTQEPRTVTVEQYVPHFIADNGEGGTKTTTFENVRRDPAPGRRGVRYEKDGKSILVYESSAFFDGPMIGAYEDREMREATGAEERLFEKVVTQDGGA